MTEPTLYQRLYRKIADAEEVKNPPKGAMLCWVVPVKRCELDDTLRDVPGIDKLTPFEYLHLHQAVTEWGAGIGGDDE